jgi:osmoprotectant transport system ATP-binding protein
VRTNVGTVPRLLGWDKARVRARVDELLETVGLDPQVYGDRYPAQLSGGQRQRAGVARALAADPLVILADEPSGNLDHGNSERLHQLFARLSREFETALVVVTHNRSLAARADRVLSLESGRLETLPGVESMP